uniref:Peptidase A2 domain-containing protein n=1 Tax=Caenorhabditis japonica TaxID=281687 RepID=A0A8R1IDR4_CAEJA
MDIWRSHQVPKNFRPSPTTFYTDAHRLHTSLKFCPYSNTFDPDSKNVLNLSRSLYVTVVAKKVRPPPRGHVDSFVDVFRVQGSVSEQIRQQPPSSDEKTRALIEQQAHTIKMQANQLKDIKWRLHAYHMEETPSESPSPSVNVFATNNENPEPPKTVSHTKTSFITAQIPITATGHPCHALIDTGANITVTSETSVDLRGTPPSQNVASAEEAEGGQATGFSRADAGHTGNLARHHCGPGRERGSGRKRRRHSLPPILAPASFNRAEPSEDFTFSPSETIPVYTPPTIVGPPPEDSSSDDLEVDVSDQEEYVVPQKLESDDKPEVNNPVDIDYPVPDVQEGVPISIARKDDLQIWNTELNGFNGIWNSKFGIKY